MKNETSFTTNNSKFTEAKDVKINENLKTKTFCQFFFFAKIPFNCSGYFYCCYMRIHLPKLEYKKEKNGIKRKIYSEFKEQIYRNNRFMN